AQLVLASEVMLAEPPEVVAGRGGGESGGRWEMREGDWNMGGRRPHPAEYFPERQAAIEGLDQLLSHKISQTDGSGRPTTPVNIVNGISTSSSDNVDVHEVRAQAPAAAEVQHRPRLEGDASGRRGEFSHGGRADPAGLSWRIVPWRRRSAR